MTLADVKNALLTVSQKVYHYTASATAVCPYLVWAEDGQSGSLHGDGRMMNQVIQGTVHLFTKSEGDILTKSIPTALTNAGIGWSLNSIQYEPDTKIIHTEWVFDIPMGV